MLMIYVLLLKFVARYDRKMFKAALEFSQNYWSYGRTIFNVEGSSMNMPTVGAFLGFSGLQLSGLSQL
jgi:hypothetical protein